MGDRLVVSVTARQYVRKGPGRPVFDDDERREQLLDLRFVDEVYICHAARAEPAIRKYRPAVYVKGVDYLGAPVIPQDIEACAEFGTEIVFTDTRKYSSGKLVKFI